MSESVTITGNPLAITVDDGSPTQVVIVDNNSGSITVTDGTPRVTVTTNQPTEIVVHNGIGGKYDFDTIEGMLLNKITGDFLDPTLNTDIQNIRDLWNRIGSEIILLIGDEERITQAVHTYTDGKFIQALLDASVDAESKLNLRASSIEQTVDAITSTVLAVTGPAGALQILQSQITQTAADIVSTVLRINAIDDPITGRLTAQQSSINQNADEINLRLLTTDLETNQVILDLGTSMSAIAGSISNWVTRMDDLDGSFSSARTELTATTAKTEVIEVGVGQHDYRLTATETMLANQWGVTIVEDAAGVPYATGFGLLLHPDWSSLAHAYAVDDTVWFVTTGIGSAWKCLIAHTSSSSNYPGSVSGYWEEIPGGKKTSFAVLADEFKIRTSADASAVAPFIVSGEEVTINGELNIHAPASMRSNLNVADGATRNDFRGQWTDDTLYYVGDNATNDGSSWTCILQHTSTYPARTLPIPPAQLNTWWALHSQKGDAGTSFNVEVESTAGTVFRTGRAIQTTLIAHVFENGVEITDYIDASRFAWRRVSYISNPVGDAAWNVDYRTGFKQIIISIDSVDNMATFHCDIESTT